MRLFENNDKVTRSNRTSDTILLAGSSSQTIHTEELASNNKPSYNIADGHRYGSVNSSTNSINTKHFQVN